MDWLKKIYTWAVGIPKGKLLYDYACALITLFVFALEYNWLSFGHALLAANIAAWAALVAKEIYDTLRRPAHTPDIAPILWGLFGALKVDAALGILLIAL